MLVKISFGFHGRMRAIHEVFGEFNEQQFYQIESFVLIEKDRLKMYIAKDKILCIEEVK
jgi:hypothetical protein